MILQIQIPQHMEHLMELSIIQIQQIDELQEVILMEYLVHEWI
jgi:hypothetical protein